MYARTQPETIRSLFSRIAPRYDLMNSILSLGMHVLWNRSLIREIKGANSLLDLCAGTGAIGLPYLKNNPKAQALLVDFCPEMLEKAKKRGHSFGNRLFTLVADVQELKIPTKKFEAVSIAYGIRNVNSPSKCFQCVYELLEPGGTFAILELTRPKFWIMRKAHKLYTMLMLPLLGYLFTGDRHAYSYLAKSVQQFTPPEELLSQLLPLGFSKVKCRSLMGGIATLIIVKKSAS